MAKTVQHQDLKSYFGTQDHLTLSTSTSFSALIYELLTEQKPTEKELKVFELILNISIDHGDETPSAVSLIEKTKKGATISEAVAAGILEINDRHGGAIEPAMNFFYKISESKLNEQDISLLVKEYLDKKKLIGGFGHRIYKIEDPRAELILNVLIQEGFDSQFIQIARRVEQSIENEKGVKLPLNIDGAIAVCLCTMNWSSDLSKAVFIIARTPGLCAHFINNTKK